MPYRRPAGDPLSNSINWSPRDMLIPYILLAVSLRRTYGYLIEQSLRGMGAFSPDKSTLYRTLRQLEKDGFLLSDWEQGETGPRRRVYTLTDAGRAWLDAWSATLGAYRGMIDTFFSLYAGAMGTANAPATAEPERGPEETDE